MISEVFLTRTTTGLGPAALRSSSPKGDGHLGTFAVPWSRLMILSLDTRAATAPAETRLTTILHNRSDAFARGAVVLLPAVGSPWVDGRGRPVILVIALAVVAIVALLVAAAAHLNGQRHRTRSAIDDEELFTTTPLPLPTEELARLAKQSSRHEFRAFNLPRWVQLGSLIAALGMTWFVAQRLKPGDRSANAASRSIARIGAAERTRDEPSASPEDLDLSPDSAPAFAFRVRDWVERDGGCAGLLEVTKGEPRSWNLTARVHDGQGQLIDTARARVATLREGDVVEFTFPRAHCDRIGAWDVRGSRRDP